MKTALSGLQPGSISAQVRAMMPTIENEIARGVPHAEIVKALNDSGLPVAFTNFESILYRYRKKWGKAQMPSAHEPEPHAATRRESPASPPEKPDDAATETETGEATNTPDREAFEASLDPVAREKFADQFMGRRRPIGAKKRSSKK